MSRVLTGKLRRVGNSVAVIVPKELLEESGAREGDEITLAISIPKTKREKYLDQIIGLDKGKKPFQRERNDRF